MDGGGDPSLLVRVVVPGPPRGKGRPRAAVIAGRARIYTPHVTAAEEGAVRLFASQAMAGRSPITEAVDFRLCAYMPVPASWSRTKRAAALSGALMPTGRPDLDNVSKLVMDSFNELVWRDDTQVVNFSAWKRYATEPRLVIEVRIAGSAPA
jgi:Holliday junction resolvase RusA-like endonuclease